MRLLARAFRLPQDCFLCGGNAPAPLCEGCEADLPRLAQPACPVCALPSPGAAVCGTCLARPPAYDATGAALRYAFPADRLVQAFKYRHALGLGPTLAAMLATAISSRPDLRADVVVPLPVTIARLAERGYNQSLEIARLLPRAPLTAFEPGALERTRHAPPQADLPWKERERNVKGAFTARRRLDGLTVAVVDDVMTTGATVGEAARTLKAAGAARVVNWVVARTLPERPAVA